MGVKGKQARGRRVDHPKKLNRKLVDFNSSTDSTAQLNPQRMEGEWNMVLLKRREERKGQLCCYMCVTETWRAVIAEPY